MNRLFYLCGFLLAGIALPLNAAVLQQQMAGVLAFEAESFSTLINGPTGSNFSIITTTSGVKPLPANTNAVGAAIYANRSGGAEDAFATYQLAFTSNGTYNLYARYSFYEVSTNTDYGQEDSYYSPTAFGQAATTTGSWSAEFLSFGGYHPTNNPNEGAFFLWDAGLSTYVITGASEADPVMVTFTIRMREGGTALDRFVLTTTPQTIANGLSSTLDAMVSVPEPGRAVMVMLGALGLVLVRRRSR
ncbi:PEP-CTERM sorting domain-containing protein [Phragmitibacter flavus]|uniref:PEP-CTERM sorting domain-containing protein n=1 Tax=Phragmitibacter flavus TaxID=2576071 RepID=A0A5R8KEF1_9BACT|nr:PEP-CTERM sorting domain-containing protein [Phragmitibacter flavus]TLD70673.1 PEP-CTERM sorting domain-containing protein [Phragmitibacter flavus]